jgi:hypothetical protein
MPTTSPCGTAAAIGLWLSLSFPAPSEARPDPLNAQAQVPPVTHRSSLASFRHHADVPLGSWQEANELVTRIGGWRSYLREAAQPEAPPAAKPVASPPAAPAAPAPARPAAGHQHHGKP